jgi:hypothetical protein
MDKALAIRLGAAACAIVALAGCKNPDEGYATPPSLRPPAEKPFVGAAEAGVPVATVPPSAWQAVVASRNLPAPRPDPFALHPIEAAYEVKQNNMRVFGQTGQFFTPMFTPTVNQVEIPILEPQPYRRLAGILVGETVLAIIDMGDGRPMRLVRPGERITNTPWTVASIDEEKAVLRRSGPTLPHEVVVRLETPPSFAPGPGTGGGQNPPQGSGDEDNSDPSRQSSAP